MMRGLRRGRAARIWSGTAVVAALALAGPAAVGTPALVAVSTTTDPAVSAHPTTNPPPLPPIPLPMPGQSLRDRAGQGKNRLDDRSHNVPVPDAIASWGLDLASGKLSVDVVGRDTTAATAFLLLAGVDPTAVTMRTDAARPRPLYDLVGGNAINDQTYRCSLGVNAKDRSGKVFVLTAGHCTKNSPTTWYGANKVKIGTTSRTNFPITDFASIAVTNSDWKATAKVQGGPTIKGSNVAAVGAGVCRSGSTTGYKCGVVQAYNQTVNYGGGDVVFGMTKTNVCAEPGDSGGTFVTPSGQAQGFTSGGSGDCTKGGTTFFQPVKLALSVYGLTLVTG